VTEPPRQTIRDLVAARSEETETSSRVELLQLETCLQDTGPVVAWLHGPAGVGKTRLLNEFGRRTEDAGANIVRIDCNAVEPTASGLLGALGELLAVPVGDVSEAASALSSRAARVIVAFDNYEVFRLADSWLRRVFIPALDAGTRIVLVSREPPAAGWLNSGEWRQCFIEIPIAGFTPRVPEERAHILLADMPDFEAILESVCVVRRVTQPMLGALCPDEAPDALYDRLAVLDIFEPRRDGLSMHEIIRRELADRLRAGDPGRYRQFQRSAWRVLRDQLRQSPQADLWRYTADVIYLIENPVIREAFFPSESAQTSVEPALPGDFEAISAIASQHETGPAADALVLWWNHLPGAFSVVKDAAGDIVAFYCMARPDELAGDWMHDDPVARSWQQHLFRRGPRAAVPSLFLRRWLSRDNGEAPCAEQAAAWVDIKRTYLELRPQLRRVYLTLNDIAPYGPVATELGFMVLEDLSADLGGEASHTAMLDFGPGSVDGWIFDLVATELGIDEERLLDSGARELVIGGARIPLTPLEYGVVSVLESRSGEAVSRAELLREVWGHAHEGGSNVVDAVIRGLRRKCGENAGLLETVRGVGYRLRN
jgi:hypothetical protein